jgi:DNA polymerase V
MAKLFALVYCSNFFIACERIFKPGLEGKPVVVISGHGGWVVDRSPEAELIGINPGMMMAELENLIQPHGIVVLVANSALYRDISGRVMSVLQHFGAEIETHDLGEAWLELPIASDVPEGNAMIEPVVMPQAIAISDYAQSICHKIKQWIGIPITIGIAPTKTLAKVASQLAHQSDLGVISLVDKSMQNQALSTIQVSNVWGIDRDYAQQLEAIGITKALQLRDLSESIVQALFDPGVWRTICELQGQVCFALQPNSNSSQAALMFRNFGEPVATIAELEEVVATYMAVLAQKLQNEELEATTISIMLVTDKLSYAYQHYNSTEIKLPYATSTTSDLTRYAIAGLGAMFKPGYRYQKLGITLSALLTAQEVGAIAGSDQSGDQLHPQRQIRLTQMIEKARSQLDSGCWRFGDPSDQEVKRQWQTETARRSQRYTTDWNELPIAKA